AHAEVVGGPRIDVQLRRDTGALQRLVHDHAMARVADDVGPAVDEEDRRRLRWNAQAGSEFVLFLGLQVARIDPDGGVRAAADLVDVVDWLVGSLLEARCGGDCRVAPRREADHADSFRVDAPLLRLAADQADGALGVLEWAPGRLSLGLVGAAW